MAAFSNNSNPYFILASQLPGQVSHAQDPTYSTSINSYLFLQARLTPQCIVFPKSALDVSRIIKTLGGMQVKAAVRGGGHTPIASAANIENGVTIDLSDMNTVSLGPAHPFGLPDKSNFSIGLPSITKDSSLSIGLRPSASSASPNTAMEEAALGALEVLSAGGGATWGDVYYKLKSTGLISIGGRGTSLGVGGLTTGGWFKALSSPWSQERPD